MAFSLCSIKCDRYHVEVRDFYFFCPIYNKCFPSQMSKCLEIFCLLLSRKWTIVEDYTTNALLDACCFLFTFFVLFLMSTHIHSKIETVFLCTKYFLACKCGVERTSRIVGGTEVNPVRLKYSLTWSDQDKSCNSLWLGQLRLPCTSVHIFDFYMIKFSHSEEQISLDGVSGSKTG